MRQTGVGFQFTICFAVAVAGLHAQTLPEVLGRIDKAAPQFKAMTADIKRDVHTAIVNDDALENGTIKFKREKAGGEARFLIEIKTPDEKAVAFDGSSVSIFYPKIKTVQVYDVKDKRSLIDQFLLLGFGATSAELQKDYDVSLVGAETVGGVASNHIQLVPKSKEVLQRLKKAELWIADASGSPAQQKFTTSSSGDFMLVTYSNMKTNGSLADSSLKLNLPKGTVVQHPQF